MIAIRVLELTKPIEVPEGIEDRQAVRFYCTWRGEFIGYATVWNKGRPLGRNRILQEIASQLGQTLATRLFSQRFEGKAEPWSEVERLIRMHLGVESPAFEPEDAGPAEPEPKLPNLTASITIPTRDRPDDIRRCLESLTQHKSRMPFEIIVADNNPSSGLTEPVVRSFPGVMYLPEPRPGVTFARNAAALHAKGDIIVCTDDDVTYLDGWLDNLMAPYADPEVMAVTGLVLPYELDHEAQYWFEVYGGLTRNYQRTRYDREFYDKSWPSVPSYDIGVTANASFRAEIFADPKIGPFDDELRIAEDPYMLYRIVKANRVVIFEPKAIVQHRHRTTMKGLARQLYNYGRSGTGMQLRTYFVDGDKRGLICFPHIAQYDYARLVQYWKAHARFPWSLITKRLNAEFYGPLRGHGEYPLELITSEIKGHIVGPFSLAKSIFQVRTKLNRYTAQQFAYAQAARQRDKAAQAQAQAGATPQLTSPAEVKQLAEPTEDRKLLPVESSPVEEG